MSTVIVNGMTVACIGWEAVFKPGEGLLPHIANLSEDLPTFGLFGGPCWSGGHLFDNNDKCLDGKRRGQVFAWLM
jgi:hypothetical protein